MAASQAARNEIIPDAEDFELITLDGVPGTIKEIYRADNNKGYIFMITTTGYGGDMDLICGIDSDGKIIAVNTLKHNETKGMGSRTTEEPFRSQFTGKDSSLEGVDAITGATISSTAYINAIKDAFTAYEMLRREIG